MSPSFTTSTITESRYFDLPRFFLFCCKWRLKPAVRKNIFRWNCSFLSSFQKCKHSKSEAIFMFCVVIDLCKKLYLLERLRSNMESSMIKTFARSSESNGNMASLMILAESIVVKRIQLI